MKKLVLLGLLILLPGCLSFPDTDDLKKSVKEMDWCEEAAVDSLYLAGPEYDTHECKTVDFNGDGYKEVAILEIDQDELYGNGIFKIYKYNLEKNNFEELYSINKDVDAYMDMQVGDLGNDGQEELLVNQYFGASGSALDYDLFYWQNDSLTIASEDNRTYNNQEKYLEGEETWASHFNVQIYDDYVVESFRTYKDEDPHCCPTGHNVTVYFKFDEGQLIEDKVEKEEITDTLY